MFKRIVWLILLLLTVGSINKVHSQQDLDFHLNGHLLPGKKILKIKRDFYDPYLWVLAQNNEVYRVNTQTQAIDDYTAKFAAYNNLQFIDIAGRSQDTVFIATNSTNVIQYRKGAINFIGINKGITDTVNSIGIEYFDDFFTKKAFILMIGTNGGVYTYNMNTEQTILQDPIDKGLGKVYEATYRRLMYADSTSATLYGRGKNIVDFLPVYACNNTNMYTSFLWEGGSQFGYNIHTAYFTPSIIYDYDDDLRLNLFWGNDNGMWQINDVGSINPHSGYSHFLSGIKVNKITGIYGLTSFGNGHQWGNPGLIKENLLIGTDNGFYFSSSTYQQFVNNLRSFKLFHLDDLGNIRINDICVNATSITEPTCEDGVYVASDNGLYLLKPDYTKYLTAQKLAALKFKGQPDTLSQMNVCGDISVTVAVNEGIYTGHNIQWYKNGSLIVGQTQDTLSITNNGDYNAVLSDPCENIKIESNHLKVNITAGPVFSFNYPDKIQQCVNSSDTLKTDNKPGYHYRWYTNGALNGDTTYSYVVTQSGKYQLEVSSCTGSWVPSKEVEVAFIQLPVPVITANKKVFCIGESATLSSGVPLAPSYTINWYKNDVLLPDKSNQTEIVTDLPGNYKVSVVNNTVNTDGTTCAQISAVQSLLFNPLPTVSIEKIVKTNLCDGQTITLLVHYNGGTVKWSTGETTDQINVTTSGNYQATVTSLSGCTADISIAITFSPNPEFNVNDTSICTYKHQAIMLTAPPGFSQYEWNGKVGDQTYAVTQPQVVSLMVVDTNGCQATRQIKIIDMCPNIYIPNAFTPNNDGINDKWVIEGLDNDSTASVKVFTRYGTLIFERKGYNSPWNGEYNGKRIAAGVYYYVLTAKNGTQKFSGSLTIIY